MAGIRINCPNCGRILGDTDKSIDAVINCSGCKHRAHIRMTVVSFKDYFNSINKQEQNNDKSK